MLKRAEDDAVFMSKPFDKILLVYCSMHSFEWGKMRYAELLNGGATPTEIREFLVDAENVPVTLRIPQTLRDSAKEAALLNGMNFTSFVKLCMIEKLVSMGTTS